MNVHGRWSDAAQDEAVIEWCRSLWDALAPHATGEGYVNFMTEGDGRRLESAYGASYARLVELQDRYDPTNPFRMNQNIAPSGRTGTPS
ncbi:MAG: BBE domain-containing protein [Dehalococcoidia bacterium]